MKNKRRYYPKKGFNVIEFIIVAFVIILLVGVASAGIKEAKERDEEVSREADCTEFYVIIDGQEKTLSSSYSRAYDMAGELPFFERDNCNTY